MLRSLCFTAAALAAAALPANAQQQSQLDGLIAKYSSEYGVPQTLIRRMIRRESGGNPRAIYRGNYGLMQIKLGTARSLGYQGGVRGLLDADTNMRYAVKYLAGAWRLASGSEARAVHHYAAGYYYAAKRRGMAMPGDNDYGMELGATAVTTEAGDQSGVVSPARLSYREAF
jgi:soluble lytic murein transglycosylase-like protein